VTAVTSSSQRGTALRSDKNAQVVSGGASMQPDSSISKADIGAGAQQSIGHA
jgi:hypothetical protein